MNRFKRRLIVLLALVAGAVIGLNMFAYHHANAMTRFTAGAVRTGRPETLAVSQKVKVTVLRHRYTASPILFLHGSAGPRTHVDEARRVFDVVSGAKQFQEFPGAGHEATIARFREKWSGTLRQFVEEVEGKRTQ